MNTLFRRACLLPVLIGCFFMFVAGCSSTNSRVDTLSPNIQHESRNRIYISSAATYQDEESTKISGTVRRHPLYKSQSMGLVHVAVADAGGNTIHHPDVPYFPRAIPVRGARLGHFSNRIDHAIPDDAVVEVRHMFGPHNVE